jgi:uncharacterized protein with HEPN domain
MKKNNAQTLKIIINNCHKINGSIKMYVDSFDIISKDINLQFSLIFSLMCIGWEVKSLTNELIKQNKERINFKEITN